MSHRKPICLFFIGIAICISIPVVASSSTESKNDDRDSPVYTSCEIEDAYPSEDGAAVIEFANCAPSKNLSVNVSIPSEKSSASHWDISEYGVFHSSKQNGQRSIFFRSMGEGSGLFSNPFETPDIREPSGSNLLAALDGSFEMRDGDVQSGSIILMVGPEIGVGSRDLSASVYGLAGLGFRFHQWRSPLKEFGNLQAVVGARLNIGYVSAFVEHQERAYDNIDRPFFGIAISRKKPSW